MPAAMADDPIPMSIEPLMKPTRMEPKLMKSILPLCQKTPPPKAIARPNSKTAIGLCRRRKVRIFSSQPGMDKLEDIFDLKNDYDLSRQKGDVCFQCEVFSVVFVSG